MTAVVDPGKCINLTQGRCEICGKVCFYGAIQFMPKFQMNSKACDGCGLCAEICPSEALKMVPALQG